jgi:hypothetical protein
MLRRILAAAGIRAAAAQGPPDQPPYSPYKDGPASNDIYNLLFAEPDAFKARAGQTPAARWHEALFSEPANVQTLLDLATDSSHDGRIRYLAYTRLREMRHQITTKTLVGVITEIPLPAGLDVLAAYSEGGVRYINATGKMAFFEGVTSFRPHVEALFAAAEAVIARIAPWHQPRRPPPKAGNVRLTFLVSDGLYFGEGPMAAMQREAMAGPVIQRATELLQATVARAVAPPEKR